MMTRMFRFAQLSTVVLFTFAFASATSQAWAQQGETSTGAMRPVDRLALLSDEFRAAAKNSSAASTSEPVPFSISTMASDTVPPFAGFPTLTVNPSSTESKTETDALKISFEENMPTKDRHSNSGESIDDCCKQLTEMIAGNLDSEISLDAKKRMIETALKMVARNVALKAEAKITKLRADHALEMARMQNQIGQMRSTHSAVDQINRVAGPLSHILQRNYQQALAMNIGNERLSQTLAQLGFQHLERETQQAHATGKELATRAELTTRAERQRIRLTTPTPSQATQNQTTQPRIEELTQQIAYLQRQLLDQNREQSHGHQNVQRATYNQPLQPRRQPLEPMPRYQSNQYFDANQYQRR